MDKWGDIIYPKLLAAAATDEDYQNRLKQCQAAEDAYLTIINKLLPEHREIVENYITMCEELEYRMVQLAFYVGKDM